MYIQLIAFEREKKDLIFFIDVKHALNK